MLTKIMERAYWIYQDESGATTIEYALLLALIALAVVLAINTLGTATKGGFERAATIMSE